MTLSEVDISVDDMIQESFMVNIGINIDDS